MSPRVAVIVVAAGSGTRLGLGIPKAFAPIGGRTLLERALDEVFAMTPTPQTIVVVPGDRLEATGRLLAGTGAIAAGGGATRQESVARGLALVDPEAEVVLVHDAARALTPTALLERVASTVADRGHGVVPGLPVVNTVKRVDAEGSVEAELDRSVLREIQTPQGFPRVQFLAAHERAAEDHADDAALFSASGHPVAVIEGDALAFKITTPWDLRRAEQLVGARHEAARTGIGIDIHAFDDARPLWLGGVYWPDEPGLAGHSDGDAICHAVCDALLSAAGLGDVGSRFGTEEERYADAAGSVFVTETVGLVTGAGFRIVNVGVQLVANRPKVGPRRTELETVLSDLVGAPVSVGATTADGLGFTGAGEGVAVVATCLLAP
jgi:2-C-methyl-D-erythritol 4-phosphate cytidylyltransferase/2-C-methyl-D-erythritol 2,4-cyclodiphosphate synthase